MDRDASQSSTDLRAAREREFHDQDAESRLFTWTRNQLNRAKAQYSRPADVQQFISPKGKVALDYGCGQKATATHLLLDSACSHITAFDISEVRVSRARSRTNGRVSGNSVGFIVADGHKTPFPDDAFDVVVGLAILHHLDLEGALLEVKRILKPGGRAVFREPLVHNPVLRVARALTPFSRTPDERPLSVQDWQLCASLFPNFAHHERELVATFLIPLSLLLPQGLQKALARHVVRLDDWLLTRFAFLRRYARLTILVFE
jgi:ubiquinone/menaquinone biosynthesis C-methylase UbiE